MYSLIFKQIWPCSSWMAALVGRGDEEPHPVTACESSERKSWWRFMSTILTPESKPFWFVWPMMTIDQKTDFKCWAEQNAGAHQTSDSHEVTFWSFSLERNIHRKFCLPFKAGLPWLGWPPGQRALCPLIQPMNCQSPLCLKGASTSMHPIMILDLFSLQE